MARATLFVTSCLVFILFTIFGTEVVNKLHGTTAHSQCTPPTNVNVLTWLENLALLHMNIKRNRQTCAFAQSDQRVCYSLTILFIVFRLLINFSNSIYPDQARQTVASDLEPNCLTL